MCIDIINCVVENGINTKTKNSVILRVLAFNPLISLALAAKYLLSLFASKRNLQCQSMHIFLDLESVIQYTYEYGYTTPQPYLSLSLFFALHTASPIAKYLLCLRVAMK